MGRAAKLRAVQKTIAKLDLSMGPVPDATFIRPARFDPLEMPWPFPDGSIEEALCAFRFHRVPAQVRGPFMNELWRVLAPGGKAVFVVPYWSSARAIQDPTAEWPPLSEQSFLYFNKGFRDANQGDPSWTCDFDFVYGYTFDPETVNKSDEVRPFWVKHYTNTVSDLQVVLTKRA